MQSVQHAKTVPLVPLPLVGVAVGVVVVGSIGINSALFPSKRVDHWRYGALGRRRL